MGQLEIPRRKWWHPVAIRVNYVLCQIRFVKYVFVSNTFCVQYVCVKYVLCSIRFVSNMFCVQYGLCSIRFVFNTFCVKYVLCSIRFVKYVFVFNTFVSNTFCVQYVLCPIRFVSNTFAMEYFCSGNTVAILLCQNTSVSNMFVSLLVPVCFSVTSRLIGNADDLPPLYFFNTFHTRSCNISKKTKNFKC